ncbi:MAG TPA: isocitrate/isopropylmalate family dehydrogenase [Myxococcota bacterium]|nr:isocitrate/isopropylmalate family dehydrogenase [Myxococcota bacterium]
MERLRITELLGDGIGPELAESVHSVASALPLAVEFVPVDLSLEGRKRDPDTYPRAEASLRDTKLGLKYPTVTAEESPNAVLRRRLHFSVIHRPVLSILGISSNFKQNVALDIVRVAVGGTYDDPGQRIGEDVAVSLRIVERRPCTEAARFAFEFARRYGLSVTSSSKHTIQRATDGFFEAIVREVAAGYPDVKHRVELFDALLAKIILRPNDYQVVLVLNEYGDFLSDMACGLVGSLGTGASGNYSFTRAGEIDVAMFDPAGGTAPDIAGQGIANPTAALLAFGLLLDHVGRIEHGNALRSAVLGAIADGRSTRDVGGRLDTRAFTAVVADSLAKAQK